MTEHDRIRLDLCCAARLLYRNELSAANAGHISMTVSGNRMLVSCNSEFDPAVILSRADDEGSQVATSVHFEILRSAQDDGLRWYRFDLYTALVNHFGPSFATLRPGNVVVVDFSRRVLDPDLFAGGNT